MQYNNYNYEKKLRHLLSSIIIHNKVIIDQADDGTSWNAFVEENKCNSFRTSQVSAKYSK